MPQPELATYCADQVRRFDHDRYLTALFAPAARRDSLFALYAFNLEIAKTREVVSEPTLGLIRLQWWRDSIAALYDGKPPPRHEVLQPLAAAIRDHGLDHAHFEQLIEAREQDMERDPPPTLPALLIYAEGTAAPLMALALEALGVRDAASLRAARAVGVAWALTGLVRAVAFHAGQQRIALSADLLDEAGVDRDRLMALKPQPELNRAVARLAETARERLAEARALRREIDRRALPALLLAALADRHLDRLERAGWDVMSGAAHRPDGTAPAALAWRALRGRY
ncbi:MAG TPA: phytoene/squalene synthase family protein [Alphaproteobacteria bacterium]|nr:phytoene/squalene synthase family protein [Alphaproteobacteria bacterium]